jgi:hypothetical protein
VAVDRKVITTVALAVEVDNVQFAVTAARNLPGVTTASEQTDLAADHPSSTLVLKVAPDQVEAVLTSLGKLGKVVSQTEASDDVTAQYVDLQSRITAAQASVERVRQFLDKTTNVAELANIEAELTRRQADLESLLGQQRVLSSQTAQATITVNIRPAPPVTTTTTIAPTTTTTKPKATVSRALHNGTHAVTAFGTALAIAGAYLLPWSPLLVLVIVVLSLLRRRDRRRPAAVVVAPPAAGPNPPAPPAPPTPPVAPSAPSSDPAPEAVGAGDRG